MVQFNSLRAAMRRARLGKRIDRYMVGMSGTALSLSVFLGSLGLFCLAYALVTMLDIVFPLLIVSRSFAQAPRRMNVVPIPRVKTFTSVQEFYQRYGTQPVIIEGGIKHHPFFAHNMTFESLASMCDGAMIDTLRHNSELDTWAAHQHEGAMPFKQYVHEHILNPTAASAPAAAEEAPLYAMCDGFGLPIFCPALNDVMPVPHIGTHKACAQAVDERSTPLARVITPGKGGRAQNRQ